MYRKWRTALLAVSLATLLAGPAANAQNLPDAPPMGWNSWDAYGLTITESQFRDNVEVLKAKLAAFGWKYAVIDEGWFLENPEDRPQPEGLRYAINRYGQYVPVPARFPSAPGQAAPPSSGAAPSGMKFHATVEDASFKDLAAWVHGHGLKFGIHIVRGIPRAAVERNLPIEGSEFHARDAADTRDACPWDPTNWGVSDTDAGQAWYDALLRQYASWGVDLLKVDCIADRPYKSTEIQMIRRAIDKTGRTMVLSLSPGPTSTEHAAEVSLLAQMWRISNDVWDVWEDTGKDFPQSIRGQFQRAAAWDSLAPAEGHWPDLDMLPLGELRPSPGWGAPRHTRLTPDEQRSLMTLWVMSGSPLILGANLTLLDPDTVKLLINREVLRVDRAYAHKEILHSGDLLVRRAELPPKGNPVLAVALFNFGENPLPVDMAAGDLGFHPRGKKPVELREAWSGKRLGRVRRVQLTLPPHGCALLMPQ